MTNTAMEAIALNCETIHRFVGVFSIIMTLCYLKCMGTLKYKKEIQSSLFFNLHPSVSTTGKHQVGVFEKQVLQSSK